jgi:STE24 endopeptidase
VEPLFTAAQLEEVRAYHAPIYTAALVELVVWPLLTSLLVFFGTRPLYRLATRLTERVRVPALERAWQGPGWAAAVLFALLFFGALALAALPVTAWFDFVRERQFGLSTQSFAAFAWDELKAHGLFAAAVTALAFGLFGIARRTPRWWWLVGLACGAALAVSAALDPYRSLVYVDQAPLPEGPLRTRLVDLLAAARVEWGDIVVLETSKKSVKVQAAFSGSGPTRTILLTDTLLAQMTEDEIVAAVAHEAGHVSENRWLGRVVVPLAILAFLGFIEWLSRLAARRGWFGITERADVRVLPLVALLFDLVMTASGPVAGWRGREREYAADRVAVALTGSPRHLSSLLVKLARVNKTDPEPPGWYVLLGASHPPLGERLAALQKNATPPPTTPVTEGTSPQQSPAPGMTR